MQVVGAALALLASLCTACHVEEKLLDPPGFSGATWAAEPARMADAVVEMIAVGVHLGATLAADDNYVGARQRLGELKIRHAMDLSFQPSLTRVQELGQMGVRSQIWIEALDDYFRSALSLGGDALEAVQVDPLASAGKFDDAWLAQRRAFCGELFAAVRSARPAGMMVVGPDVDFPGGFPLVDFGPCVDFGTVHRQSSIGPPTAQSIQGFTLDQQLESQRNRAALRPLILGRDGYSTRAGDAAGAVSELVQAKYLARLIFEAFNRGFVRIFLGGITDRPDDEQAMNDQRIVHFGAVASDFALNDGLTHFDGTPKPSFIATRNLVALLADPGAPFATGSLTYRIDGAPETLHHTLLQKRDGTFFLALWLEIPSTDAKVAMPVIVRFPSAVAQVTTLLPQESAAPINQLKEVSALALDVSDHLTLVQIAPYLPAGNNLCDRSRWKATASVPGDGKGPAAALDGNLTTRWDTLHRQGGMDWFQVDFGASVRLTNITLNNTQAYPADYPGGFEIYGSLDGVTFDVLPFSTGAGTINATVINFSARLLRAVRINQVGIANNIHWWGIGEFQTTCSM